MFPIKSKYTLFYRHGQKTFYNSSHIGVDLGVPEMTPIYAPEDGVVNTFSGGQGGQWLSVTSNRVHRFAHLKQYVAKKGQRVKEGDLVAYSGGARGAWYSGNSTNPHIHWDVFENGKYIDPLLIKWNTKDMKLSDFIVDGMPADQRIDALKDQVRRLLDEIKNLLNEVNRWKEERFKWYDLANEYKNKFDTEVKLRELAEEERNRKEGVINDLNRQVAELRLQLGHQGLTPEQSKDLSLIETIRNLFK